VTRAKVIPDTIIIHVPFRLVKRGGRKEMVLPPGEREPRQTDNTLVKALARGFRWKRMLESGEFTTIAELAEGEGIAPSYLTRVMRMTLLAPEIVEAIVNGRQGPEMTLARLLEPFASIWTQQMELFDRRNLPMSGVPGRSAGSRPVPFDRCATFRRVRA